MKRDPQRWPRTIHFQDGETFEVVRFSELHHAEERIKELESQLALLAEMFKAERDACEKWQILAEAEL